jgi:hypothetical protein
MHPIRIRRAGSWLRFFEKGQPVPFKTIRLNEINAVSINRDCLTYTVHYKIAFKYLFCEPETVYLEMFKENEKKAISQLKYMLRKQLK